VSRGQIRCARRRNPSPPPPLLEPRRAVEVEPLPSRLQFRLRHHGSNSGRIEVVGGSRRRARRSRRQTGSLLRLTLPQAPWWCLPPSPAPPSCSPRRGAADYHGAREPTSE
jgi:hypothetical protein